VSDAGARTVVVFSGGGTGGHLYPALALADALRAVRPDIDPVFIGAARGIEARVLPARGEVVHLLPVQGMPRGGGVGDGIRVGWALVRSLVATLRLVYDLRPAMVVVTGGYAGGPAGLVAVALRIPLVLQEQNARAGVTTRVLSRWARQVHVAFPEAQAGLPRQARDRVILSGNPVRSPDVSLRPTPTGAPPTVLVVGGSQGSVALNEAVLAWVLEPSAVAKRVVWATGPAHVASLTERVRQGFGGAIPEWLTLVGYIDDMPRALAQADLAVSRAGATGTAEFLVWGIPAILVPLPTAADDHQTLNARSLEARGAARWIPQEGLDGTRLGEAIDALLADPARRGEMAQAALSCANPHAAEVIARHLSEAIPLAPSRPSSSPPSGRSS
jgi:UDP-N-acetylglucosamine--N-acetylmuramyl-(pentapeptide) pyrophosphoryl-undecaprenol N-acetylglucosamine transferase